MRRSAFTYRYLDTGIYIQRCPCERSRISKLRKPPSFILVGRRPACTTRELYIVVSRVSQNPGSSDLQQHRADGCRVLSVASFKRSLYRRHLRGIQRVFSFGALAVVRRPWIPCRQRTSSHCLCISLRSVSAAFVVSNEPICFLSLRRVKKLFSAAPGRAAAPPVVLHD